MVKIWATEREQKKHQCFVLAPKYNEIIIDDNHGKFSKSEYTPLYQIK